MSKYITLLGAWSVIFPLKLSFTLMAAAFELFLIVFNMPFEVWSDLDEHLKEIHIEDK